MLKELTLKEAVVFTKDDPVRPHIAPEFRVTENRKMFGLVSDDDHILAVICVAFNSDVPASERDLSDSGDFVATFYTVWSYSKGCGREIVFTTKDWILQNVPSVGRFVTLSPPTDMARKFHLNNGALELDYNTDTVNFEYK